ncbi:Threonylcarbamoyladenosine tRNA methylthiotransferase [Bienertia sinuspersici]
MEDIEDLMFDNEGVAPGFRLPVSSVGLNPKKKPIKFKKNLLQDPLQSIKIPGTQIIYIKTFGCSHNQEALDVGKC